MGKAGALGAARPAPCITETCVWRPRKVSPNDVTMNKTATAAVNLARKGAAPAEPKTVWLEPPKAAPIPAPLPCCNRTTQIKARQTMIWTMMTKVIITFLI